MVQDWGCNFEKDVFLALTNLPIQLGVLGGQGPGEDQIYV